jgi:hypothetical protein
MVGTADVVAAGASANLARQQMESSILEILGKLILDSPDYDRTSSRTTWQELPSPQSVRLSSITVVSSTPSPLNAPDT